MSYGSVWFEQKAGVRNLHPTNHDQHQTRSQVQILWLTINLQFCSYIARCCDICQSTPISVTLSRMSVAGTTDLVVKEGVPDVFRDS